MVFTVLLLSGSVANVQALIMPVPSKISSLNVKKRTFGLHV